MKKTHLLLMLALCATLLASCSAGEPDVTQTQPVPSISPTNTPDENTVLPGLDDDIILPDGGRNDSIRAWNVLGLRLERYRILNRTKHKQTVREPEFWRNGVLAVATEASDLAPGASADLWLVRSAR